MTILTWKLTKDTTPRKRRFKAPKNSILRNFRIIESRLSEKVNFSKFLTKNSKLHRKKKNSILRKFDILCRDSYFKISRWIKKKCEFGSGWKMYIFVKTSTWIVYRVYLASLFTRHLNLFFYWTYTHRDELRTNRPDKNLIRAYYLSPRKCRENVRKWPKIFEKISKNGNSLHDGIKPIQVKSEYRGVAS